MNQSVFARELRRAIAQTAEMTSLYEGEATLIRHPRKRSFLLYVAGELSYVQNKLERLARNEGISLPDTGAARRRGTPPGLGAESQACFAYLSLDDIAQVVGGRCAQMRTYYSRRHEEERDYRAGLLCGAMAKAFQRVALLTTNGCRRLGASRRRAELPFPAPEAVPAPSLQV